jgi:hypothetical protein
MRVADGRRSSGCPISTVSPSVTICSPTNNSSVASPVKIAAGTTDTSTVYLMQIYVDGSKKYEVSGSTINTSVTMTAGTHRITVHAYSRANNIFKCTVYATGP